MVRPARTRAPRLDIPAVMTVAGSDNSGGAGIEADLKTFTTLGVYGTAAITCVVAENPKVVQTIRPMPPSLVREQIELVLDVFPVRAMKTGMLYSGPIIHAIADALEALPTRRRPKVVIDPVMVATSGALLLKRAACQQLVDRLFPMAAVVTPNLDEASLLCGRALGSEDEVVRAAAELTSRWGVPFLVKGGHLKGKEAVDFLVDGSEVIRLEADRIPNVQTHGTGCTYSAAITAGLALGLDLPRAVVRAKEFVTRAIASALTLGRFKALNHLPLAHPARE
ncbi:MAG: bifunctional hydroxymethylpyrimidine kinase/phosphomethylpyrimidine kinase [Candidatus Methylacidiphilales bacterium]